MCLCVCLCVCVCISVYMCVSVCVLCVYMCACIVCVCIRTIEGTAEHYTIPDLHSAVWLQTSERMQQHDGSIILPSRSLAAEIPAATTVMI